MGTPRHLRDSQPKYALVLWPDSPDYAKDLPSCIPLSILGDAIMFGAKLLLKEDDTFCKPRQEVSIEPRLLRILREQRHPYRNDADWQNEDGA